MMAKLASQEFTAGQAKVEMWHMVEKEARSEMM